MPVCLCVCASGSTVAGSRIDLHTLFEGEREIGGPGTLPAWFSECERKTQELEEEALQIRRDTPRDVGIGIRLAKKLKVLSLQPEGAAAQSGLIHDDDTVKAVDGQVKSAVCFRACHATHGTDTSCVCTRRCKG